MVLQRMTSDGQYLKRLSVVDGANDFQPDIRSFGLAVSPASKTTPHFGVGSKSRTIEEKDIIWQLEPRFLWEILSHGDLLSHSLITRLILAPTIETYWRIMDMPCINVNRTYRPRKRRK